MSKVLQSTTNRGTSKSEFADEFEQNLMLQTGSQKLSPSLYHSAAVYACADRWKTVRQKLGTNPGVKAFLEQVFHE